MDRFWVRARFTNLQSFETRWNTSCMVQWAMSWSNFIVIGIGARWDTFEIFMVGRASMTS